MKPAIELDGATVYLGSNLDVLPTLPDNSVDSIVTDPPYELGFMGKSWDSSGIAYSVELWTECMRVLKPGGHLLAFGGSRTWHRLAVAIEDAGFEMRDSIAWLYGSGFPKSMDISKALDKAAGAEREVLGTRPALGAMSHNGPHSAFSNDPVARTEVSITAPATPEAIKWQGWGTALKPAFEPVVVARKPFKGTVASNVLEWETGGLNIDGSRIGTEGGGTHCDKRDEQGNCLGHNGTGKFSDTVHAQQLDTPQGRWPANIILDPYTAELLDEQAPAAGGGFGIRGKGGSTYANGVGFANTLAETGQTVGYGDSGGASRFFYVAKASKRDRNEGLDGLEGKQASYASDTRLHNNGDGSPRNKEETTKNFHPTVKPTSLMEYLIKLVTPEGGTVLDPFTGSGSTGKAALLNDFKFIGIELTEEYLPIIEGRLKFAQQKEGLF